MKNKMSIKTIIQKVFKAKSNIVTRMAPSPTGVMHIGTARTALFNYLYAKQHNGKFILRIEDTDKERSLPEYEEDILNSMQWLGLEFDEKYRQSERTEIYKKYLKELIDKDLAYVSEETEGKSKSVIRFRNPGQVVKFQDEIRGEISFDTTELGDFVIAKDLDTPLYHLAVVVDDHEMGITHIIRGEDGISNTPRQILIQRAIGAIQPVYAHLSLILATDKTKLSKRHGAVSINEFKKEGYLKESLINFLAFLGWNPGTEKELYSMQELLSDFNINKVSKSGAVFNKEKLNWFNLEYLRNLSDKDFLTYIKEINSDSIINIPEDDLLKIKKLITEKSSNYQEIKELFENGEFNFMKENIEYDISKLNWKDQDPEISKNHLNKILELLQNLNESDFKAEKIKDLIWDYATKQGRGNVLWPMRYALSGQDRSPDPFVLSEILGKKKTFDRMNQAIHKL